MNSGEIKTINFYSEKPKRYYNTKSNINHKKRNMPQNIDIFEVHKKILTIFDKEYDSLRDLKDQAKRLTWISENSDNLLEREIANNKIKKLNQKITSIESGYREATYLYKAEPILKEYNDLLNKPIKVEFMKNTCSIQDVQREKLISDFLNIAKDYIDNIEQIEIKKRLLVCEECRIDLQIEEDFLYVCPQCGKCIKYLTPTSSFQENNRINTTQRYVYERRGHFVDAIKKFQGKENTTIPDKVYEDIRRKIECHDIPIERLTKDHIYEFLRLTGNSDYYENIILIYSEITKKPAPDISHLEQELFRLFDKVDHVYDSVKPPDRVNFLNGQFVLFKLLQKLNYPCNEEDFYILKTREKILEHDKIWANICQVLKWTPIPTV